MKLGLGMGLGSARGAEGGDMALSAPVNLIAPAVMSLDGLSYGYYGTVVSCQTGTWSGEPTSYAYQWYVDAVPVDGATGSSWTVNVNSLDQDITCRVTAVNADGSTEVESAALLTKRTLNFQHLVNAAWETAGNWWDWVNETGVEVEPQAHERIFFTDAPNGDPPGSPTFDQVVCTSGLSLSLEGIIARRVYITNETSISGQFTVTGEFYLESSALNGDLTAASGATVTFYGPAASAGSLSTVTKSGAEPVLFYGGATNLGHVSGPNVTFEGGSVNHGLVNGTTVRFWNVSLNLGEVSAALTEFADASHEGTVYGNAAFDSAYLSGDVHGNAVFTGGSDFQGWVSGDVDIHYPANHQYGGTAVGIVQLHGYIFGCMDPGATNYHGGANTDDGSCTYEWGEA